MLAQLKTLLEQVRQTRNPPEKMLIPIVAGGNHWVSLFVMPNSTNPTNPAIAYVNSFGYDNSGTDGAVVNVVRGVFNQADIVNTTTRFQHDGHSCGPITVHTLATLAEVEAPAELRNVVQQYERSWQVDANQAQQVALRLRGEQAALPPVGETPALSSGRVRLIKPQTEEQAPAQTSRIRILPPKGRVRFLPKEDMGQKSGEEDDDPPAGDKPKSRIRFIKPDDGTIQR